VAKLKVAKRQAKDGLGGRIRGGVPLTWRPSGKKLSEFVATDPLDLKHRVSELTGRGGYPTVKQSSRLFAGSVVGLQEIGYQVGARYHRLQGLGKKGKIKRGSNCVGKGKRIFQTELSGKGKSAGRKKQGRFRKLGEGKGGCWHSGNLEDWVLS